MTTQPHDPIGHAEAYLWRAARLLERLRFDHLFRETSADRVLAALEPYQNADGGFGQALEPDFRGPISQPVTVLSALEILDEIHRFDTPCAQRAVNYLAQVSAADGGLPFVGSEVAAYPRAPWWEPQPATPGCLLPTAPIAGLLHRHGLASDFRDRASDFCWSAIAALPRRVEQRTTRLDGLQIAYEARAAMTFLEHSPERERARGAADRLGELLLGSGLLAREPAPHDELMGPLDYAPHPGALARAWFSDEVVERQLDALLAAQQDDGGYTFAWAVWTPAMEHEWRGIRTVSALKTLRAYGRI